MNLDWFREYSKDTKKRYKSHHLSHLSLKLSMKMIENSKYFISKNSAFWFSNSLSNSPYHSLNLFLSFPDLYSFYHYLCYLYLFFQFTLLCIKTIFNKRNVHIKASLLIFSMIEPGQLLNFQKWGWIGTIFTTKLRPNPSYRYSHGFRNNRNLRKIVHELKIPLN